MASEQDDKVNDLLNDMQAEMTERKAARFVRRVKHGRAAIVFVAFIYVVKLIRVLDNFEQAKSANYIFGGIIALFIALFILSRTKAYTGLLIATIAYILVVAITTIMEMTIIAENPVEEIAGIQRAAYLSTIIVRIGIFYFLIYGMRYAKKLEALYDETGAE